MSNDTRDSGIPTRAIHESYLNVQDAHQEFRRARDSPNRPEDRAQAQFQESVLTFYELLRPHLKRKASLSKFWRGELPRYPDRWWGSIDEAKRYCKDAGTAIWTLQTHVQTAAQSPNVSESGEAMADGGGSPKQWHDRLQLTDMQRVIAIDNQDGMLVWRELRANAGLKRLDSWQTGKRTQRTQGDGFMAGETAESVELRYVPAWKLTKAKRLLAEAADKMNLLSRVEIDHEDGAIVNFDQSRDDARAEYRDAEYSNSPDI